MDPTAVSLSREEQVVVDLVHGLGGEVSFLVGGSTYRHAERLTDRGLLARLPDSDHAPSRLARPFRRYRLTETGAEIARVPQRLVKGKTMTEVRAVATDEWAVPAPGEMTAFAEMVAASFQEIAQRSQASHEAFVVDVDGDALWVEYLDAFPEGANPVYRKRTDHDCATCRQFVRRAGGVVALEPGGSARTVWDRAAELAPGCYRVVADRLRRLVAAAPVRDLFRVGERELAFGAARTRQLDGDTVRSWDHLHTGEVPRSLRVASPDEVRGAHRTTVQVFERGLAELSPDAVDTVHSLVEANSIYRGGEHMPAIVAFRDMQREFLSKPAGRARSTFAWANAHRPAARFRNTVVGTLVQDLSAGVDVDQAVRAFEAKVAPQNYKRTTAVITPAMVKKAMETVAELGLEPALERRFAVIGDVSVGDVRWVDGSVRPLMRGGIGEVLMQHAEAATFRSDDGARDRAEPVTIDDFVSSVLPGVTALEIFFDGDHVGNLMSLTAPVHAAPPRLFRWDNDFAWSYGGNVADSIRDRVRKAGGKVDGAAMRVSLSWSNYDDLDLHVFEPVGRGVRGALGHIFFGAKRGWTGGVLDVDMNAGIGTTREPVENVVWAAKPPDGAYRVVVNNYRCRESSDPGFAVEVESGGKTSHFSYNKGVRNSQDVHVATLHVLDGRVVRLDPGDPAISTSAISQERWGLRTEQYVRVSAVMLSPNYWGGNAVGNKHTFFVVEGAKNDEPARGFYNEFLHPRLEPHRKVFEVVADKTKCVPTDGQLSGLGFSSTKRDSFVVRAHQGKKHRLFNVRVGA